MSTGTIPGGVLGQTSELAANRGVRWDVWCGATPSCAPLSSCSGHHVAVPLPSWARWSTSPPSGVYRGAPSHERSWPCALRFLPGGRQWGTKWMTSACPSLASRTGPPPTHRGVSQFFSKYPGMLWHGGPSGPPPSERRWSAPSSTACPAPPSSPSPRCWQSASPPSHSSPRSVALAWPWGHATIPAISHLLQSRHPNVCLGYREPSLRRPFNFMVLLLRLSHSYESFPFHSLIDEKVLLMRMCSIS